MNTILALGGVLEAVTGLALLLAPALVASVLLGATLSGPALVVARMAGAGLLALGIACWGARVDPSSAAGLAVAWGYLVYNLLACALLARARPPVSQGGLPGLGAALTHCFLSAALLWLLLA